MNAMVGDAGSFSQSGVNLNNANYVQFFKAFSIPRPSEIFVFLDEHPDSIDDGYFVNSYAGNNGASDVDMIYPHRITTARPVSRLRTGIRNFIAGAMPARNSRPALME